MQQEILVQTKAGWLLKVHVQPNAKCSGLAGLHGDAIKIRLQSPPVDGKANQELIRCLAKLFGLPRNRITLVSGRTSRGKTIALPPLSRQELYSTLQLPPNTDVD